MIIEGQATVPAPPERVVATSRGIMERDLRTRFARLQALLEALEG